MKFTIAHTNINVADLEKSLEFYQVALRLKEVRRITDPNGAFKIVFLADEAGSTHKLELTYLRDMERPYELGDNESHIAFVVDDFDAAHALHEKMGCICYENTAMGIYFINDPDGYWLEILPKR